jgi:hypothetical protein
MIGPCSIAPSRPFLLRYIRAALGRGGAIAVARGFGAEGSTMPQSLTQGEAEVVAALKRTNAALRRITWQLKRVTSQLKACVRLAASNAEGLQQVYDDLERLLPRERPVLRVVKEGDDA